MSKVLDLPIDLSGLPSSGITSPSMMIRPERSTKRRLSGLVGGRVINQIGQCCDLGIRRATVEDTPKPRQRNSVLKTDPSGEAAQVTYLSASTGRINQ
ncbi:hypothetical protein [Paenibacillus lutimineralis]|uniref:Uncharacterized protein n=1 Tax=Paenibacillus lutimineralis TaxID=2707005 RepID=A0A3S9UVL1_9BACL|nr:hypothetical protein [Paenibacillus lutimineralis]AZS14363.1 hypothetical protein EI981_07765 [Paenibacillus lutimineralis]